MMFSVCAQGVDVGSGVEVILIQSVVDRRESSCAIHLCCRRHWNTTLYELERESATTRHKSSYRDGIVIRKYITGFSPLVYNARYQSLARIDS